MLQYKEMLRTILRDGVQKGDRTGTGTYSIFGYQFRHNLQEGFPLLTTKKIHLKAIIHELLWFLSGSTNIKYLVDNQVKIWNEWADTEGELGPVYGYQWRRWDSDNGAGVRISIDQITEVIDGIRKDPDGRRHIVTAWNPSQLKYMALPPCHLMFQFYVANGRLSCHMYQRSADAFLGVPFNIASYALLTMMIAQVTGLSPGDLIISYGDLHIYKNHMEQVLTQQKRATRPLPSMRINPTVKHIDDFVYDDFTLEGYDPHPAIQAPVAV